MSLLSVILLVFLLCLFITLLLRSFVIVRQYEQALLFRLGRYVRTLPPGLSFIIPFFDVVAFVDLRIHAIDVPPQQVITKDNAVVRVDATVYYRVLNGKQLLLNVGNYVVATVSLAQTTFRSIIGNLLFDELNAERERINRELQQQLSSLALSWGIEIIFAEIGTITPVDKMLTDALEKQVRAERNKRAVILESEGKRESMVLVADGLRQSLRILADGQAVAKVNVAQGEAEGIRIVSDAASELTGSALSLWELSLWKQLSSSKDTTTILPMRLHAWLSCMRGIEGGEKNG